MDAITLADSIDSLSNQLLCEQITRNSLEREIKRNKELLLLSCILRAISMAVDAAVFFSGCYWDTATS